MPLRRHKGSLLKTFSTRREYAFVTISFRPSYLVLSEICATIGQQALGRKGHRQASPHEGVHMALFPVGEAEGLEFFEQSVGHLLLHFCLYVPRLYPAILERCFDVAFYLDVGLECLEQAV